MSRNMTRLENGEILEEIESKEVCKWRINEVCCNDESEELADYPYPSEKCYKETDKNYRCEHYEDEDGIIETTKEKQK